MAEVNPELQHALDVLERELEVCGIRRPVIFIMSPSSRKLGKPQPKTYLTKE